MAVRRQYAIMYMYLWRVFATQNNVAVLVNVALFLHIFAQRNVAALVVVAHA